MKELAITMSVFFVAVVCAPVAHAEPWEYWGVNQPNEIVTRYDGPEYEDSGDPTKFRTGLDRPAKWQYQYVDIAKRSGTYEFGITPAHYGFVYVRPVRILSWEPSGSDLGFGYVLGSPFFNEGARRPLGDIDYHCAFESIPETSQTNFVNNFSGWQAHKHYNLFDDQANFNHGYIQHRGYGDYWIDAAGGQFGESIVWANLQYPFIKYLGPYCYASNSILTTVAIPEGVTHVEMGAFRGCSNLVSVAFPSTLKSIGPLAFADCVALASVEIPAGVTEIGSGAFAGCSGAAVTWNSGGGSGATCAADAFAGCADVSVDISLGEGETTVTAATLSQLPQTETEYTVNIPEGAENLQASAFQGIHAPINLRLPSSLDRIAPRAFAGSGIRSVTISAASVDIGEQAFANCRSLERVDLYHSMSRMGKEAFAGCTNLTSVRIGSATNLGERAFNGCTALAEFDFPQGLEAIDKEAFLGCKSLGSLNYVSVPEGVTTIGEGAFRNCSGLVFIELPSTMARMGKQAFEGCAKLEIVNNIFGVPEVPYALFKDCHRLRHVQLSERTWVVPTGVTEIGDEAFRGCWSLPEITLPSTVKSVGRKAFAGCNVLRNILLPDGLNDIDPLAFRGCLSLEEITIPPNVKTIGYKAFAREPEEMWDALIDAYIDEDGEYDDEIYEDDFWINEEYEGCPSLRRVIIGTVDPTNPIRTSLWSELTSIGPQVWGHTGGMHIGESAFADSPQLSQVVIGGSVAVIDQNAFANCPNLSSLSIQGNSVLIPRLTTREEFNVGCIMEQGEDGVPYMIGYDIQALESYVSSKMCLATIPLTILDGAFLGDSSLSEIDIPSRCIWIGTYAFANCGSLRDVNMNNSPVEIGCGIWVFLIDDGWSTFFMYLKNSGVALFHNRALLPFLNLSDAWITVKTTRPPLVIGDGAFRRCQSLEEMDVPDRVSELGSSVFTGCSSMTNLFLPASADAAPATFGVPSRCAVSYRMASDDGSSAAVPYSWLASRASTALSGAGGKPVAAALSKAANGRPVWECYVADLDPESETDLAVAVELVDGKPDVRILSGESPARTYTTQGAKTLGGGWDDLEDGADWDAAGYRFFRVKVELP